MQDGTILVGVFQSEEELELEQLLLGSFSTSDIILELDELKEARRKIFNKRIRSFLGSFLQLLNGIIGPKQWGVVRAVRAM